MDMSIVHHEWAKRPDEERFVSLHDLHNKNMADYHASQTKIVDLSQLRARPMADDPNGLEFTNQSGNPAYMSNWAFEQFGYRLEMPVSYLKRLPAELASANINWALDNSPKQNAGMLITKSGSDKLIRAVTSEKYGRIWNYQVSAPLTERFGDGITGDWKAPGEFGKEVEITKRNTTFYGNDKNMFVMLCDEKNKLQVPNRRNGQPGMISRGFIVVNSEVGDSAVKLYFFTFDHVCQNRNIWGLGDVKEITVRHTLNAPERWIDEVAPAIEHYGMQRASIFEDRIIEAQAIHIAGDEFDEKMIKGMSKAMPANLITQKMVKGIHAAFKADESRPMETVWDMSVGISAFARSLSFQEDRIPLERAAGKILELVAN